MKIVLRNFFDTGGSRIWIGANVLSINFQPQFSRPAYYQNIVERDNIPEVDVDKKKQKLEKDKLVSAGT